MRIPRGVGKEHEGANMTPMIDVVFLLIIFFLVSSHLSRQESKVPLDLPFAESGAELDFEASDVTINVTDDRRVIMAGTVVADGELTARLNRLAAEANQPLAIRLRVDASLTYGALTPVLQAIVAAGVGDLRIGTSNRVGK